MSVSTRGKFIHYAFKTDHRARCGAIPERRSFDPSRVTCRRCVRALAGVVIAPVERIALDLPRLELPVHVFEILERAAELSGNRVEENAAAVVLHLLESNASRIESLLL